MSDSSASCDGAPARRRRWVQHVTDGVGAVIAVGIGLFAVALLAMGARWIAHWLGIWPL